MGLDVGSIICGGDGVFFGENSKEIVVYLYSGREYEEDTVGNNNIINIC